MDSEPIKWLAYYFWGSYIMDATVVMWLFGGAGCIVVVTWGIIKHLTAKIDKSHEDAINKIDEMKREYVSHAYLDAKLEHINQTQIDIKKQISDQGVTIIGLLSRRRDD